MHKSILLVDEDPGILAFLTMTFEDRGFRVLRARSQPEMVEILERPYVPVDVVLVNVVLLRSGNTDLEHDVSRLRNSIPVVHMSAFVEAGVARIGAVADDRDVVETVNDALSRSRARASAG